MEIEKLDIHSIKRGYTCNDKTGDLTCIFCGKEYRKGFIYECDGQLCDAEFSMKTHMDQEHGSVFDGIISFDKKTTGLSDIQKTVLEGMYKNLSDEKIAGMLNNVAGSTVRNHKMTLRAKYREAKMYCALMELITEKEFAPETITDELEPTDDEWKKIMIKYVNEDSGRIKRFPKKLKEKLVLLDYVFSKFKSGVIYSEKETNEIIKNIFDDYVTIRRYLIDFKFLMRKKDCSEYWTAK